MTPSEPTSPEMPLPWMKAPARDVRRVPHLILAWSLDEPERLGEALLIEGPTAVGRGAPLADDPSPRGQWCRMRPGSSIGAPPLANARVSRLQFVAEPAGESSIRIRSLGRAAMRINGQPITEAVASAGDVIEIHNAALFLVANRAKELAGLRSYAAPQFEFGAPDPFGIVGEGERTWQLREALAFAAAADGHVLLMGESGVGKELAAKSLHGLSARRDKAFVARNAATLPEALIDAELFGNVKNYPNPGMPERPGLVGEADGAILFLDEIGDLPEKSQVHLLRLLDNAGEYQRLGDAKPRRSSLRLIAATNRPLEMLKHDFLARFLHRISLPGLAERREEVPLVLAQILRRVARTNAALAARFFERRNGTTAEPRLAPDLVYRLLRHPFTHHVRELERLVWLALTSARADYIGLTPEVEAELKDSAESDQQPTALDREALVRALDANGRSPTRTAKALGLKNRYVLLRLLKKHGLSAVEDREGSS